MQHPAPRPELASWKDSPAIVRLSEFIQANRHHGIHVITKDGRPVLQFKPGLNRGSRERWDAALKAELLYSDAVEDLMKLIKNYKLTLPDHAPDPIEPEKSEQSVLL